MDFNKMMQQAKKIQAEIEKKEQEFNAQVFTFEKQGIKLVINGKLNIVSLDVNEALIDPEDKETLQDMIIITINEAINDILEKKEKIKSNMAQGIM